MSNPGHAFAAYSLCPETFRTTTRPLIFPDLPLHGRLLCGSLIPVELIDRRGAVSTEQIASDRPAIVSLDMGRDFGFRSTERHGPIAVDDPVITDVAPTALLDMPTPDLDDFLGEGPPRQPLGEGVSAGQENLGDWEWVVV